MRACWRSSASTTSTPSSSATTIARRKRATRPLWNRRLFRWSPPTASPTPRPRERELLDVLTCVRQKVTLATAGRLLERNSERYVKTPAQMARLFADLPEAIAHTLEISSRLQFTLADLGYQFPRYPVPEGETQMSFLRKRVDEGARRRYQPYHERARRQIERELALIEKLKLPGYFLIVWDIVRFCKENAILAQGRGSAANSAVCYSLEITAVDPVGMDLLFERFLSEERGEWPDIDHRPPQRRKARARHPVRLPAVRKARRRHDRQRHHLSRPLRRARSGQGAGLRGRRRSNGSPAWCARGNGKTPRTRPKPSSATPAWTSTIRACASFSSCTAWRRTCRATWASIPAAWWSARGSSIPWCRSNPPPCPAAWWCSGTRKTAPIWGSSRWTCSAWA